MTEDVTAPFAGENPNGNSPRRTRIPLAAAFLIVTVLAGGILWFGHRFISRGSFASEDTIKQIKSRLENAAAGVTDLTQRVEVQATVGPVTVGMTAVLRYKGIRSRMESEILSKSAPTSETRIFDGKDNWLLVDGAWQKQPKEPDAANGPFWWRYIPDNARLARIEKMCDRECYVITFHSTEQDPFSTFWVDKENLRLLKAEGKRSGTTVTFTFSEYKTIRGDLETAYKFETIGTMQGSDLTAHMTSEIKSVQVNAGLADDLFEVEAK